MAAQSLKFYGPAPSSIDGITFKSVERMKDGKKIKDVAIEYNGKSYFNIKLAPGMVFTYGGPRCYNEDATPMESRRYSATVEFDPSNESHVKTMDGIKSIEEKYHKWLIENVESEGLTGTTREDLETPALVKKFFYRMIKTSNKKGPHPPQMKVKFNKHIENIRDETGKVVKGPDGRAKYQIIHEKPRIRHFSRGTKEAVSVETWDELRSMMPRGITGSMTISIRPYLTNIGAYGLTSNIEHLHIPKVERAAGGVDFPFDDDDLELEAGAGLPASSGAGGAPPASTTRSTQPTTFPDEEEEEEEEEESGDEEEYEEVEA